MKNTISVQGIDVRYKQVGGEDYISLTDMAKKISDEPRKIIENWLRNWSTLEYLGLWETFYNPDFNRLQFEAVSRDVKKNTFLMSPQKWIENMNAIGMISKAGRYDSGTFAHKDIAFKFASWLSVEFEFYIIKEFQRLKAEEQKHIAYRKQPRIIFCGYWRNRKRYAQMGVVRKHKERPKVT